MITARSILLISFFILPNSAISETLCLSDEKVAFTCNIKVRIASLCASTIVDPDKGNIQYRFGTRSNIEFQFPSVPSGQGREFHLSLATYGGGGETHIRFREPLIYSDVQLFCLYKTMGYAPIVSQKAIKSALP